MTWSFQVTLFLCSYMHFLKFFAKVSTYYSTYLLFSFCYPFLVLNENLKSLPFFKKQAYIYYVYKLYTI